MQEIKAMLEIINSRLSEVVEASKQQAEILKSHDKLLVEYNYQLKTHIKRTELLEEAISTHKVLDSAAHKELSDNLLPLVIQKKAIGWIIKFVLGIGALAGAIAALVKTFG